MIAQAIEENPNAHFGREKYQLRFIEWMLSKPGYYEYDENYIAEAVGQPTGWIPNFLAIGISPGPIMQVSDNVYLENEGLTDAYAGLSGLITLGGAWESVDAFYTLSLLLQADGKSAFAYFAMLRVSELVSKGKQSLVSGVTPSMLDADDLTGLGYNLTKDADAAKQEFTNLRTKADNWQEKRHEYMLARLNSGKHPDTQIDFWDDFEGDPEHMEVPSGAIYQAGGTVNAILQSDWFWILCIFLGGATLMTAYYLYAKRRDRKKRAARYAA